MSESHPDKDEMQTCAEFVDRVLDEDATDDERDELVDIWFEWNVAPDDPAAPEWRNSVYPFEKSDSEKQWVEVTPHDTENPLLQRIRVPESHLCDLGVWR
jgi:hypothetical protein